MLQKSNPYSDTKFVGYVTLVSPGFTNVHFPSSVLLKKFYRSDEGFHAITGKYVIIEGSGNGFLGKITEIALPENERLSLTESNYEHEAFHPTGKIEVLLCYDNFNLKAKKGLDQLPPVGAKVYLCSNEFLGSLLTNFGNKKDELKIKDEDKLLALAHLPHDQSQIINVSSQALFGRHCAVVGTTGGGKSWTVAKLIESVLENKGKAILIDATGEYHTLKGNSAVQFLEFNSENETDNLFFNYRNLRETDIYALFRPTGQAQIPKLQEAMRSLRLIDLLNKKDSKTSNDLHLMEKTNGFWSEHATRPFTLLTKASKPRKIITTAYKENISVFNQFCNFDINALPYQIFNECVRDFGSETDFGVSDGTAAGFCQSLISRILVTVGSESFKNIFGFNSDLPISNEFTSNVEDFLKPESKKDVLIISVSNVPSENKLREILVNAIGRFLLEKALKGNFKKTKENANKSLLLFLDEAHLFLNKRIKDEYSIEIDLDAFDRIAKECRKYGLFLVLSTQMPRDIPKGVLSQMGTFIVHRLINHEDRESIEYACSEANKSSLTFLPILSSGEAMLTGVDFPMPVILKIIEPNIKPDSSTPSVF
jgi:uncharacterized protein